ncbi:hypothetical protein [Spiroplasma endosymbiont of Othius punctulatus]|uniref:hypothetical protein n=1 Tax=Spiroplasma endosymbiont of Othius punctulatus TaxID=3066289 RepID=UPI0030D4C1B0
MNHEIYASLQVTKKEIRFVVLKYRSGLGAKLFFKEIIKGEWLGENDEVLNFKEVGKIVKKSIHTFENQFKGIKLEKVNLILPTKTLKIEAINSDLFLNQFEIRLITENEVNALFAKVKQDASAKMLKREIVNIKPISFVVNGNKQVSKPPINVKVQGFGIKAQVFSVAKEVIDSHKKVIFEAGKDLLKIEFENISIAKKIVKMGTPNPTAIVNWSESKREISYAFNDTVINFGRSSFGIDTIIDKFSNETGIKTQKATEYIYSILNLSNDNNANEMLYRKYISATKTTIEYTRGELKNILISLFKIELEKIELEIKNEFKDKVKVFDVIFIGDILNVPGVSTILSNSKFDKISIFNTRSVGQIEYWTSAHVGIATILHNKNKNSSFKRTSTQTLSTQSTNKSNDKKSIFGALSNVISHNKSNVINR